MKIRPAVYAEHIDKSLNNNPLTEALRFILTKEHYLSEVAYHFEVQNDFMTMPQMYHQTQLDGVKLTYIPLLPAWSLYIKVCALILSGYKERNPLEKLNMQQRIELAEIERTKATFETPPLFKTTAECALLSGPSGTGKSSLALKTLHSIPQTFSHNEYKGKAFVATQLVWISFSLPATNSSKAMALNFFEAIDKALGTSYAALWSKRSNKTVDDHFAAMRNVAMKYNLGIVHIDDLQFMLKYKTGTDSPNLTHLEALFNKIGIPILLSSTSQGLDLLKTPPDRNPDRERDMSVARRMLTNTQFTLKPLKNGERLFTEFFESFFQTPMIVGSQSNKASFMALFADLTCGIPGIMCRLATLYIELHLSMVQNSGKEIPTFSEKLLQSIFDTQFDFIKPALNDFKKGKMIAYEEKYKQHKQKLDELGGNQDDLTS